MPKLLSVSPEKDKIVAVSVPFNVTDDKYRYVHFNLNEGLRKTEGMAVSEDVYNQMIENTNLSEMISAGKITVENFVLKPVATGSEIIPVSVPVLIQEYQVRFNHVDINKGIFKQNGLLVKDAQFEKMGSQPLDLIGGGHIEVNDEVFTVEEAGKVTATDLNDDMFVDLKIVDTPQTIIIVATKMENDTFKLTCKLGDHEFVSETNVEEDFEGEVTFVFGRYSFHVSLDCSSDSLTDEEEIALGALILNEVGDSEDPENPENPENPDNPENPKSLLFVPFTSSSEPTLFGKYSEDFIKMCELDLYVLYSQDSDLLLEGQYDVMGLPEGSHRLLTVISKVGDSYNAELHSITTWEDMTYNGFWEEWYQGGINPNIKKIAEGAGVLSLDNKTYSFSLMPLAINGVLSRIEELGDEPESQALRVRLLSAKELLQKAAHVATVPVEAVELIDAAGLYVEYNGVVQTGELAFSNMRSNAAESVFSYDWLSLFAPIYNALQPDLEYKLFYTKVNDILTLGLTGEAPLFENDEPPVERVYCLKGQVSGTPDVYIRLLQEPSDDFEVPFAAYYTEEVSNPASEDPRAWISEFDSDTAGALLSAVVDSELLPESFEDYYSIKMELPRGAEQLSLIIEGQNEEIRFTSETYTANGDIRTFSFGDSELQGLPLEFTVEVDKEVASGAKPLTMSKSIEFVGHGQGSSAYAGGVLLSNGKICLVPRGASNIGIYDPVTHTFTEGPAHEEGADAFSGGVPLSGGKVCLVPYNSANIGIYDPDTDTYTQGPTHGHAPGAFSGGVSMADGKICLVPHNSANVGIYDSVENTYTDGPLHGLGANKAAFSGGVRLLDDKVCFVPFGSDNIGIYDPTTGTYTDGPTHEKGTNAFAGSTMMPNGKVMLAPNNSPNIGIYDPIANTYTNGPAHEKSYQAFFGSTLMPNGKVMLTPRQSANIGIYDPAENTYTDGPAHGEGSFAFAGSTMMPNGKVLLTPFNSLNIGIYDPDANTYTDGPEHRQGTSAFVGSTSMLNGKVLLVPHASAKIGIYDPIENTYTDGPAHGKGVNAFYGCTMMPNGKVMLTPQDSANIGIYDPVTDTYTDGPEHGKGEHAFYGCTLMPNGKVMLAPRNSANIGIYDPVTNEYTDGPAHGKGTNAFIGSTLLPNGKVMLTPLYSPSIGIYDPITGTYTPGPVHEQGDDAFSGGIRLSGGEVCLVPYNSANIGIYDPVANTYTDGPEHGRGAGAFNGGVAMADGKICLVPHVSANVGIYDPAAEEYTDGPAHGQGTAAFMGGASLPDGGVCLAPFGSANIGVYDPDLGVFVFPTALVRLEDENAQD